MGFVSITSLLGRILLAGSALSLLGAAAAFGAIHAAHYQGTINRVFPIAVVGIATCICMLGAAVVVG